MSANLSIKEHSGSDYAIGDIQGCYDGLQRLLDKIKFDEHNDRLWFVGDLVNRGPHSLEVLRFIKNLPIEPIITLGNHDLYLIKIIFSKKDNLNKKDTLQAILNAPDVEELGHWLRKQCILYHDSKLNIVMSHAGIAPIWSLKQAKDRAKELEKTLANDNFHIFLDNMLGDIPDTWSDDLTNHARLRLICNYFTRMRFCKIKNGGLDLNRKGNIQEADNKIAPWFSIPNRIQIKPDIVFGHWASLGGVNPSPTIHAIDTGFVWGGAMTALRLQDKRRFSVKW